jgi:hypothetical protein
MGGVAGWRVEVECELSSRPLVVPAAYHTHTNPPTPTPHPIPHPHPHPHIGTRTHRCPPLKPLRQELVRSATGTRFSGSQRRAASSMITSGVSAVRPKTPREWRLACACPTVVHPMMPPSAWAPHETDCRSEA